MHQVIGVILGGGMGKRLYPLTATRSKPAVPFAGNYRIVDIPISNCIHSDINRIFVLTQFNSASLNRHINQAYKFDIFHQGFVEVLASEETIDSINKGFPHGTAEAVRKALRHFLPYRNIKYVLVLAGDQLYKMNFRSLVRHHIQNKADITLGVLPVKRREIARYGIIKMDKEYRISGFFEKPQDEAVIQGCKIPGELKTDKKSFDNKEYFASMNMYIFNIDVLRKVLMSYPNMRDFGKEILPTIMPNYNISGYIHTGYWEDIGTIDTFHNANIALTKKKPIFNLFDEDYAFYAKPRFLPPSRVDKCSISDCLLSDGIILNGSKIKKSVIGIRCIISRGCVIENSVLMGNDFYETPDDKIYNEHEGIPDVGIGRDCVIKNAIIDKNCRIGDNVQIINKDNIKNFDHPEYRIYNGIIVIPKNSVIRSNTVI
jgi:glucose-1-phosphate adenylyltransferase